MNYFCYLLAISMLYQNTSQSNPTIVTLENGTTSTTSTHFKYQVLSCQRLNSNYLRWRIDHDYLQQKLGSGYQNSRFHIKYQTTFESFANDGFYPTEEFTFLDAQKNEMNEVQLLAGLSEFQLYFNNDIAAAGKNGNFYFDLVAESTDGKYKIIHKSQVEVRGRSLDNEKFNVQYEKGYARDNDSLIIKVDNPCAFLDEKTAFEVKVDYYNYRFSSNKLQVFQDVPSDCLVKVNGVEKMAKCTKVSERVLNITDAISDPVVADQLVIELSGVKVHPITTMLQVVVYNEIFDYSQQLFQLTQWDINVKLPVMEKQADRIDENSTSNAHMTTLIKSDVNSGIEYGAMNFRVNSEILKHCQSFQVKITDMRTRRYSYGTVSLNSLGEGKLWRVYPFDLKNQVKFEYFFPIQQNKILNSLRVYAHILEGRRIPAYNNNPIVFDYVSSAIDPSNRFNYHMSNLFIGGKNRMNFTISQSNYDLTTIRGRIQIDPSQLGRFDEQNLTEVWVAGKNYKDKTTLLADGSIEIGLVDIPNKDLVIEVASLQNSIYFTGPTQVNLKVFKDSDVVFDEDMQFQLSKNKFTINQLTKSQYGSEIILDIDFTFDEIVDFDHYFRIQLDNGVVKAADACVSSASFSYDVNTTCQNINDSTLKLKNLLANAPVGVGNTLRLKVLNPNGASSVNVTVDIFPDTTEVMDIQDPSSENQISVAASANVSL